MQEVERGYRLQAPVNCPTALYILMLNCWHPDAAERPTFTQIRKRLDALASDEQFYAKRLSTMTKSDVSQLHEFYKNSSNLVRRGSQGGEGLVKPVTYHGGMYIHLLPFFLSFLGQSNEVRSEVVGHFMQPPRLSKRPAELSSAFSSQLNLSASFAQTPGASSAAWMTSLADERSFLFASPGLQRHRRSFSADDLAFSPPKECLVVNSPISESMDMLEKTGTLYALAQNEAYLDRIGMWPSESASSPLPGGSIGGPSTPAYLAMSPCTEDEDNGYTMISPAPPSTGYIASPAISKDMAFVRRVRRGVGSLGNACTRFLTWAFFPSCCSGAGDGETESPLCSTSTRHPRQTTPKSTTMVFQLCRLLHHQILSRKQLLSIPWPAHVHFL